MSVLWDALFSSCLFCRDDFKPGSNITWTEDVGPAILSSRFCMCGERWWSVIRTATRQKPNDDQLSWASFQNSAWSTLRIYSEFIVELWILKRIDNRGTIAHWLSPKRQSHWPTWLLVHRNIQHLAGFWLMQFFRTERDKNYQGFFYCACIYAYIIIIIIISNINDWFISWLIY